jgi:hypothetical protein
VFNLFGDTSMLGLNPASFASSSSSSSSRLTPAQQSKAAAREQARIERQEAKERARAAKRAERRAAKKSARSAAAGGAGADGDGMEFDNEDEESDDDLELDDDLDMNEEEEEEEEMDDGGDDYLEAEAANMDESRIAQLVDPAFLARRFLAPEDEQVRSVRLCICLSLSHLRTQVDILYRLPKHGTRLNHLHLH